jgi:hypothetical protein
MRFVAKLAIFTPAVLVLGLSVNAANAFVAPVPAPHVAPLIEPVAMCGHTCRSGGRYIPGPPEVCYRRGMEYCGSSRPGVSVGVPGMGVEIRGPRVERERNCRTVTVERSDGSVTRRRSCD